MRIGLVVPGGVGRGGEHAVIPAFLWLLERLSRRHDVEVVALTGERTPASWSLLGARVHNVGAPATRPRAIRTLLRLHAGKSFDVFHALWAGAPGDSALMAGWLCGVPSLVHVAGGELADVSGISFGEVRRPWSRALAGFVVRHASCVTAASSPMLDLAEAAGAAPERVPLGVDLTRWSPAAPRPRDEARPLRLVHVGSLTPVKDHDTLLRALALVISSGHAVHLDIVGEDALSGAVQRLASELGVANDVTFHGFVPQARLVPIVRAADAMVVSSRHEAGPLVALEAAAVGVPTVGTRVGHVQDLALDDAAVAVEVGDARALARGLSSILDRDERRMQIAQRAQDWAIRHDADATCRDFESLYSVLAEGGRR